MTEKKDKRIVYFDVLRILSILAVVVLHVSAQNWDKCKVGSAAWTAFNLGDGLTRWSVPVLIMVSGALFLQEDRPMKRLFGKNILRLVAAFVFWSAAYALWDRFVLHKFDSNFELFRRFVLGHDHMWYLCMLIGLYLIVPLLKQIADNRKTTAWFLILACVFSVLLPQCVQILNLRSERVASVLNDALDQFGVKLVLGYSGYFLLGHLLHRTELSKRAEVLICILGVFGAVLTVLLTTVASASRPYPTTVFYSNFSVNVLLTATAIFVFAKRRLNKTLSSDHAGRLLSCLSKCSFGVYLIHPFLIETLSKLLHVTTLSFSPFLSVPVLSAAVFLVSVLLSWVMNQIPFIKKWLV